MLYTQSAFQLLKLHPLALDLADGTLSSEGLRSFAMAGRSFSLVEIGHFEDVKVLVRGSRIATILVLLATSAIVIWAPHIFRAASTVALVSFVVLALGVAASYQIIGFERTSIALHSLAFEENSFIFTTNDLMPYVYRNQDMVNGAIFVLGLTFFWLVAAWAASHIGRRDA